MPGKRVPADPNDMDTQITDADKRQAGIQNPTGVQGGGQWRQGEAPLESTYRERPNRDHQ